MSSIVDQPPSVSRPDLASSWDLVIDDVEIIYPKAIPWTQTDEVLAAVISDMRERDRVGRERYGVPLTAHNGRDQLIDLYQELLDAAVYARTALTEGNVGLRGTYHNTLDNIMNVRAIIEARATRSAT